MTYRYLFYLLLAIFLLIGGRVTGQTFQGQISDAETETPLEGVEVYLPKLSRSVYTDVAGNFSLPLATGEYEVYYLLLGYASQTDTLQVADRGLNVAIQLQNLQVSLDAVVVREEQEKTYALQRLKAVEGTAIYAGKKTEVILLDQLTVNAAANNARQIYGQISGINIQDANDAGLQLNIGGRGLNPNRSASFNTRQNGYDISADVLGYPESYYTPPAEALREIQIIRGAASLQYGTQFGGLVNFVFKTPEKTKPLAVTSRQTVGSNGLFTSFNSLSGTTKRLSYYTYYNYKRGDG
ncbi:MAG: carboxypeptidase-like regulatory domain-containing protein, partial [Bacteroidota bacterium]